jgi:hypothetical protein
MSLREIRVPGGTGSRVIGRGRKNQCDKTVPVLRRPALGRTGLRRRNFSIQSLHVSRLRAHREFGMWICN